MTRSVQSDRACGMHGSSASPTSQASVPQGRTVPYKCMHSELQPNVHIRIVRHDHGVKVKRTSAMTAECSSRSCANAERASAACASALVNPRSHSARRSCVFFRRWSSAALCSASRARERRALMRFDSRLHAEKLLRAMPRTPAVGSRSSQHALAAAIANGRLRYTIIAAPARSSRRKHAPTITASLLSCAAGGSFAPIQRLGPTARPPLRVPTA